MGMIRLGAALRRVCAIALSGGMLLAAMTAVNGEDLSRPPHNIVYFVNGTLGDKSFFVIFLFFELGYRRRRE